MINDKKEKKIPKSNKWINRNILEKKLVKNIDINN